MNNFNGLCKKYHDGKTAIRLAKVKLEEKEQKTSEQRTTVNEVNLENFFNKANIMLALLNTRFNGVDGGVAFTQNVIQNEDANVPILGSDMVVELYSPVLVRMTTFNVTNNASLLNMIKDYAEAVIKIMRNFDYDRYYSLSHDLEKLQYHPDTRHIPFLKRVGDTVITTDLDVLSNFDLLSDIEAFFVICKYIHEGITELFGVDYEAVDS